MATFFTENMIFLHLPKTGGTWTAGAVEAAGVTTRLPDLLGEQHYSAHGHADLNDVTVNNRFSVAFVRHPLDWWRSYWGYRMRTGWREDNGIDLAAKSCEFNDFIERMLKYRPGYLSELVGQFVGSPVPIVDFVGRFEHLVDDVCTALRLGGESFSEFAIRDYPHQNVSDYDRFPAVYHPDVADHLIEAEDETIKRFYACEPVIAAMIKA
jgi:hypothetical protein